MKHFLIILVLGSITFTASSQKIEKNFKKANKYLEQGKNEKAIKLYSKILEEDPKYFPALNNRAAVYINMDKLDLAYVDLKKAEILRPKDTLMLSNLFNYYIFTEDLENAQKYYELKKMSGGTHTYMENFNLGTKYYFDGNVERADFYLQKSLEQNPEYSQTLNNLGWNSLNSNPEKSCSYFHQAYEKDSTNYRNINNLGYAHLMCGNLEVAYEYFVKSQEINPDNSFIYRNYGLYYMYKEDKENACLNLKKALDLKIIEEWGINYVEELIRYCEGTE